LYLLVIVILNQFNIKKIKLTKIILEQNIKNKKKLCGKKHCNNPQQFARKATVLPSHIITVILNQLNVKK